ncbi:hypothetical protein JOB18_041215 [Solea senegalensis]|uniref:Uncharacterized protein n=1 Tax=Solea senegalensis TaxID=28829 RepID=A0AAV6SCR3_SOLSE|nr:hypothetical protein JOB18_041215 [Solea senegalensis]
MAFVPHQNGGRQSPYGVAIFEHDRFSPTYVNLLDFPQKTKCSLMFEMAERRRRARALQRGCNQIPEQSLSTAKWNWTD